MSTITSATTVTTPWTGPDESTPQHIEVLVRAVDAGPTYLVTRWLDHDPVPDYQVTSQERMDALTGRLRTSMMTPLENEGTEQAAERALTRGVFTDLNATQDLASDLAATIFPASFWTRLRQEASRRQATVRITPSRSLAAMPFELLIDPDTGQHLLELARVVYEVPAIVHYQRPRLPRPYNPATPAIYTLDPTVPGETGLGPVLHRDPSIGASPLLDALGLDWYEQYITPADLAAQLRADPPPGRWLYFGHVSTRADQPGSTSLHLSTPLDGPPPGTADLIGNHHRPFTALDIHLGPLGPDGTHPHPGHQIWPMPPRVALIACASGSDHAASEPFGLIVALGLNGAEHITTTRWVMPTDHAFHTYTPTPSDTTPTTDLTIAVNTAHAHPDDPIDTLRAWQLDQLTAWQNTPSPQHTPLLWAGITTHHIPPRHRTNGAPFDS